MFDLATFINDKKFFNGVKKAKNLSLKRKSVKGVVTIVKYDGIGDFILFLDSAKGLRELYKDKKIILSCPGVVKNLAIESGCFDEVICFSRISSQFLKFNEIEEKVSKLDCELLIHASISRDFFAEALVSVIRADKKVTMPFTYLYAENYHKWVVGNYDEFLNVPTNGMVLEINAEMVRQLGYTNFKSASPKIQAINQEITIPENYFVLFMGGSSIVKRWHVEKWYEVAKYIAKTTGLTCVLAGDYDEVSQENYFKNKNEFEYYSYLGRTSLLELIYIISKSKFVIGNDTCAIHMASALSVKSLCITSASAKDRFYPYKADFLNGYEPNFIKKSVECEGCSFDKNTFINCVKGKTLDPVMRCLREISANDFIEKFNEFIKTVNL